MNIIDRGNLSCFKYTHTLIQTRICRILCAATIIDSIKFKRIKLCKSVGNSYKQLNLCCCIATHDCGTVSGYMATRVCVQLVTFACMNFSFGECDGNEVAVILTCVHRDNEQNFVAFIRDLMTKK